MGNLLTAKAVALADEIVQFQKNPELIENERNLVGAAVIFSMKNIGEDIPMAALEKTLREPNIKAYYDRFGDKDILERYNKFIEAIPDKDEQRILATEALINIREYARMKEKENK